MISSGKKVKQGHSYEALIPQQQMKPKKAFGFFVSSCKRNRLSGCKVLGGDSRLWLGPTGYIAPGERVVSGGHIAECLIARTGSAEAADPGQRPGRIDGIRLRVDLDRPRQSADATHAVAVRLRDRIYLGKIEVYIPCPARIAGIGCGRPILQRPGGGNQERINGWIPAGIYYQRLQFIAVRKPPVGMVGQIQILAIGKGPLPSVGSRRRCFLPHQPVCRVGHGRVPVVRQGSQGGLTPDGTRKVGACPIVVVDVSVGEAHTPREERRITKGSERPITGPIYGVRKPVCGDGRPRQGDAAVDQVGELADRGQPPVGKPTIVGVIQCLDEGFRIRGCVSGSRTAVPLVSTVGGRVFIAIGEGFIFFMDAIVVCFHFPDQTGDIVPGHQPAVGI